MGGGNAVTVRPAASSSVPATAEQGSFHRRPGRHSVRSPSGLHLRPPPPPALPSPATPVHGTSSHGRQSTGAVAASVQRGTPRRGEQRGARDAREGGLRQRESPRPGSTTMVNRPTAAARGGPPPLFLPCNGGGGCCLVRRRGSARPPRPTTPPPPHPPQRRTQHLTPHLAASVRHFSLAWQSGTRLPVAWRGRV